MSLNINKIPYKKSLISMITKAVRANHKNIN